MSAPNPRPTDTDPEVVAWVTYINTGDPDPVARCQREAQVQKQIMEKYFPHRLGASPEYHDEVEALEQKHWPNGGAPRTIYPYYKRIDDLNEAFGLRRHQAPDQRLQAEDDLAGRPIRPDGKPFGWMPIAVDASI